MTNLLEYDPDWKQKFWKNNPNWTMGEFTDMTAQMAAAKKRSDDAIAASQVEGDGVSQGADWATQQHEAMYPGHQAAANAAGFTMLGATSLNKDYVARQNTIKEILGVHPSESYNSWDWRDTFGKMNVEDINKTINNWSPGVDTSDAGTTDISGILGDIFSEDEENVV